MYVLLSSLPDQLHQLMFGDHIEEIDIAFPY